MVIMDYNGALNEHVKLCVEAFNAIVNSQIYFHNSNQKFKLLEMKPI